MRLDENSSSGTLSNGSGSSISHHHQPFNPSNGVEDGSSMTHAATTNGKAAAAAAAAAVRPTWFGHDREETSRLLIQALGDLGYEGSARMLTQESGFQLERPTVAAFRHSVLEGDWTQAEALLFGVGDGSMSNKNGGMDAEHGGGGGAGGGGLVLAQGSDRNLIRFWLRRQKFLELLEEKDTGRALMVLRTELTPLYQNTDALHFLSSLLMCHSVEDLKQKAEWDGALGGSRHYLLSELSHCISPSVMLREHRLAELLQQVKASQIANCVYHNTAASPSLYSDHSCDRRNFPLQPLLELDRHSGEVWHVQFSHDGRRLASCGGDRTAVIYDAASFEVLHVLGEHEKGVCSLAWSPDDAQLVTCCEDRRARLWDAATGACVRTLARFGEPVSRCAWAPDGAAFVTGCLSRERNLCLWSTAGALLHDWGQPHRVQDLAVAPDGSRLVAMDDETHVYVYNFATRDLEFVLDLGVKLASVSISQDSRYMLVNRTDGKAELYDLETRETSRTFSGHKGGEFVIRSSFGGANEAFVVSGSEDGYIFIWHKEHGSLVEKLEGHSPVPCNSLSWNPTNPSMFASAGDDHKVRIWTNELPPGVIAKTSQSKSNGTHRANPW